mgnify:CR=1 FL=1
MLPPATAGIDALSFYLVQVPLASTFYRCNYRSYRLPSYYLLPSTFYFLPSNGIDALSFYFVQDLPDHPTSGSHELSMRWRVRDMQLAAHPRHHHHHRIHAPRSPLPAPRSPLTAHR